MEKKLTPPDDDYKIRCPRLGHQIQFSYCVRENSGLPCFKTLDCWHTHFQVEDYLSDVLDREQWEKAFTRPSKTKVHSLMDLIEQAKERIKGE